MTNMKKIISFFLTVSIFCGFTIAQAKNVFEANSVIEAEETVINNAVKRKASFAASGGYYIYNENEAVKDTETIKIADISFVVDCGDLKNGKLYMRAFAKSSLTDKFYYRINNGEWRQKNFSVGGVKWLEICDAECIDGKCKAEINHGEAGILFDAFFVTDKPENVPTETFGEENADTLERKHRQEEIYLVKGNGIIIEAEDASYSAPYSASGNKTASGMKVLQPSSGSKNVPEKNDEGELEFSFRVSEKGNYTVWLRCLLATSAQNSFYYAFSGGEYTDMSVSVSDEFKWIKLVAKSLVPDTVYTLKLYSREPGGLYDLILVTNKPIKPSGRTGGLENYSEEAQKLSTKYKSPAVKPPKNVHPRVMFRENDVERIRKNLDEPQNSVAREEFEKFISEDITGEQDGGYSYDILNRIEAFAFDYAINGNEESADKAIPALIASLETIDCSKCGDSGYTRGAGFIVYVASEVYDWCYDRISKEQKTKIIRLCESLLSGGEIGWPPVNQGAVADHGNEAQLLQVCLAFAIATYDERPDIWEAVGGRFYEEYVEAKNFFYRAHYELQGTDYGMYRYFWATWAHYLITGMGAEPPFNVDDLYKVAYANLYLRRGDGQLIRDGDCYVDNRFNMWELWSSCCMTYLSAGNIGKDPYLKDEFYREKFNTTNLHVGYAPFWLIINNPEIEAKSIYNLPLTKYFGTPAGIMVARTGWEDGSESPAVVAEMKIGEYNLSNHQHLDAGHFQIYYKGQLASDSGVYTGSVSGKALGGAEYGALHHNQYAWKSIAHNTLLVYDPEEGVSGDTSRSNILDGGQSLPGNGASLAHLSAVKEYSHVADVEAQEIDRKDAVKPSYSYIKGNLTNAYSDKITDYKRSFMFLNLFDDDVPAALIVFDKVSSSRAEFKKTWLLHTLEEPEINGEGAVVKSTYKSPLTPNAHNGKLTLKTLLPAENNREIKTVGGPKEGWSLVNGFDWTGYKLNKLTDEGDTYRLEISPKNQKQDDAFLNVMLVGDADKENYVPVLMKENNLFYGVRVKDREVYFSKSGERTDEKTEIKGDGTKTEYTVCDVKSGIWTVTADGESFECTVTEDGGVLAFESAAKSITAERKADFEGSPEVNEMPELKDDEFIYTKVDGIYIYSPDTKLVEGSSVMPLGVLCKYTNLNYSVSGDDITVYGGNVTANIKVGSDEIVSGGESGKLGKAVYREGDNIMVTPRGLSELFGATVSWNPFAKTLILTSAPADYTRPSDYPRLISAVPDDGTVDGVNTADNIIDENADTYWAAEGKGRYVTIELEKPAVISYMEVVLRQNSGRNAAFEIYTSIDGKHFEKIYEGTGNGAVEKEGAWERFDFSKPVKAKYVRYIGNASANTSNQWNAVKEIRFR